MRKQDQGERHILTARLCLCSVRVGASLFCKFTVCTVEMMYSIVRDEFRPFSQLLVKWLSSKNVNVGKDQREWVEKEHKLLSSTYTRLLSCPYNLSFTAMRAFKITWKGFSVAMKRSQGVLRSTALLHCSVGLRWWYWGRKWRRAEQKRGESMSPAEPSVRENYSGAQHTSTQTVWRKSSISTFFQFIST